MLRTVTVTRYVTPLREGGSLPAVVEADDDGLHVLKFRRAGQGPRVLVAELVVGELARALGLPVPELVFADLDAALGRNEPDPEIQDLVVGSAGLNLAMDYLPGSLTFDPASDPPPDADWAADVVWFDALTTNVDRAPQNPNLLRWHGRPWLIDHGAALYVHHAWNDPDGSARDRFPLTARHVLLPFAGSVADADERLAPKVTPELIHDLVRQVPDGWLAENPVNGWSPDEQRAAYEHWFATRVEHRAAFVDEAERVRTGA